MKKRVKSQLITLGIIVLIIAGSFLIMSKKHPETNSEIAKCIGENAILYTQLGCHACEKQKDIFGENYKFLNVVKLDTLQHGL